MKEIIKMEKIFLYLVFIIFTLPSGVSLAQKKVDYIDTLIKEQHIISKDITRKIIKYDLAPLWTKAKNEEVYGFIGSNYQRLHIKFITVKRDSIDSTTYSVYGKDKVKDNICSFQGIVKIEKAFYTENETGEGQKTGLLVGRYILKEDSTLQNTGIFQGRLITYWYLDEKNRIHYDDLGLINDGYCNNQFVGTWTRYSDGKINKCAWGDYRIPGLTEAIDNGAAEFHINDKYRDYGWDVFLKAKQEQWNNKAGSYTRKEREEWWK